MAQYSGNLATAAESPSAALARNLRLIAQNPRDFTALVAAGRAALGLGDFQAAVGFFGRAEEVRPNDPAPKIGMGAASVQMGDSASALRFFVQAQQLGASVAAIGADRGLAHDLNGNQATAQADYRAALMGPDRDEARRRLALSLGISGDRTGAFATLQPLMMRRDPGAARIRAFILALVGDRAGARSAIEAAMPGSAARIDPFFAVLPNLSPEQKAAAVHLGVFPNPSEMKLAAASPARSVPPSTVVPPRQQAAPERTSAKGKRATKGEKLPVGRRTILPPTALPAPIVVSSRVEPEPSPPPVETKQAEVAPLQPEPTASLPAPSFTLPSSTLASVESRDDPVLPAADRLSGIDKLLAEVTDEAAPANSRPKVERLASTDNKAARDKKAADARKAAEAKKAAAEKKEREALGVAGTNWVQLAGGSRADRMGSEYKRLAAKSSALKKRGGHVTQGKDYFRLLVGPFDSRSAAQSFVNTLAKDGVDGFSWTRTPATIKIEKLSP